MDGNPSLGILVVSGQPSGLGRTNDAVHSAVLTQSALCYKFVISYAPVLSWTWGKRAASPLACICKLSDKRARHLTREDDDCSMRWSKTTAALAQPHAVVACRRSTRGRQRAAPVSLCKRQQEATAATVAADHPCLTDSSHSDRGNHSSPMFVYVSSRFLSSCNLVAPGPFPQTQQERERERERER